MKSTYTLLAAAALVGLILLPACKPSASKVSSGNSKIFASADPELKADWDASMAALKTNGYADTILTLQKLKSNPKISPAQSAAVDSTLVAVNDQMYDAANKGNAAAQQSIDTIRKTMTR